MAYIYQADLWCDDCGEAIRERLTAEGKAPDDPDDEYSYDSDNYPKSCGDDEESDSPQHCAAREDCLKAEELPSGRKVGYLFGELTMEGIKYVALSVAESKSEVTDLWVEYYTDQGYDLGIDDNDDGFGYDEGFLFDEAPEADDWGGDPDDD